MSERTQPETPEFYSKEGYFEVGAHYVITSLAEPEDLIRMINARLLYRKWQGR